MLIPVNLLRIRWDHAKGDHEVRWVSLHFDGSLQAAETEQRNDWQVYSIVQALAADRHVQKIEHGDGFTYMVFSEWRGRNPLPSSQDVEALVHNFSAFPDKRVETVAELEQRVADELARREQVKASDRPAVPELQAFNPPLQHAYDEDAGWPCGPDEGGVAFKPESEQQQTDRPADTR